MKRLTIALALLLVAVSPAIAGRDDDFDFAQGLVARKYYDLAQEQFEKIISGASSADQKASGELGLALLLQAKATDLQASRAEPGTVLKVISNAEKKFNSFLNTYPNHPKIIDAKFAIGNLLRMKGQYLVRILDKYPKEHDAYTKLAEKAFASAIDLFDDVAKSLKAKLKEKYGDKMPPETDLDNYNYQKAVFFAAVTPYDRALLYPEGSTLRKTQLKLAVKRCTDYVWDYDETTLLGSYAYLYWGMAEAKLNDPNQAFEYFSVLTGEPVPDRKSNPRTYKVWTGLFLQAYYQLGTYANELAQKGQDSYRDKAVAQFKTMQQRIPDVYSRKMGHFALLEYAKCLAGVGQYDKAIQIVTTVSQRGEELSNSTDWGAATNYMANKLLNEIIVDASASGHEVHLAPKVLLKAANGKRDQQQWIAAIRAYQAVLTAVTGTPKEKDFGPQAWIDIGKCYYQDSKFRAAYFAFNYATHRYNSMRKEAGDSAYYRYRAASALAAATRDPADVELKKQTRSQFARDYPDNPRAIDLQYYEGADVISDADTRRLAGETKGANTLYEEAITRLSGVKTTSILYAKALARVGECQFKMGADGKALAQFAKVRAFIADKANLTTNDDKLANRKQALGLAAYYSARAHARMKKYEDVVADLEGFEKTYPSMSDFLAPAKFERFRAFCKLGRLKDAEDQAMDLRKNCPKSDMTPSAFFMLEQIFHDKAKSAKAQGQEKAWRAALTKAALYLGYYIGYQSPPTYTNLQTEGLFYHDLGTTESLQKALAYMKQSLDVLDKLIKPLPASSPRRKKLSDDRLNLITYLADIASRLEDWASARDYFVELLIPNAAARPRVFALLERFASQDLSQQDITELMSKIHGVANYMVGLAEAYMHLGGSPQVYQRAMALVGLLIRSVAGQTGGNGQYSKAWWGWEYLYCEAAYRYGVAYQDVTALQNVVKLISTWESYSVLKNAPQHDKFTKLKAQAQTAIDKLNAGGAPK